MGFRLFNSSGQQQPTNSLPNTNEVTFVSTLPATPVDGTEVYYQSTIKNTGGGNGVSMADAGIVWHLRYDASGNRDYPWEFIGGGSIQCAFGLHHGQGAVMHATPGTDGVYVPLVRSSDNLTRCSTPVVIPLKGDFNVSQNVSLGNTYWSGGQLLYLDWVKPNSNPKTGAGIAPRGPLYSTAAAWNFFGTLFLQNDPTSTRPFSYNAATPVTLDFQIARLGTLAGSLGALTINNVAISITPVRVGRTD